MEGDAPSRKTLHARCEEHPQASAAIRDTKSPSRCTRAPPGADSGRQAALSGTATINFVAGDRAAKYAQIDAGNAATPHSIKTCVIGSRAWSRVSSNITV